MVNATMCGHWIGRDGEVQSVDYCGYCITQIADLQKQRPDAIPEMHRCEEDNSVYFVALGDQNVLPVCPKCAPRYCPACKRVQRNSLEINPIAGICEHCLKDQLRQELANHSDQFAVEVVGKIIYQRMYDDSTFETPDEYIGVPAERWVVIDTKGMALLIARFTGSRTMGLFAQGVSRKKEQEWIRALGPRALEALTTAIGIWGADVEFAKACAEQRIARHNQKYHPEHPESDEPATEEVA